MSQKGSPGAGGAARGDNAHSGERSKIQTGIARAQDGLTLYRGTRLLGFIVTRRNGQFEAVTAPRGTRLGLFTSEIGAACALLEEAQIG